MVGMLCSARLTRHSVGADLRGTKTTSLRYGSNTMKQSMNMDPRAYPWHAEIVGEGGLGISATRTASRA